MNRAIILLTILSLFTLAVSGIAADGQQRAGSVVFAQGGGFELIRDGQKRSYDPDVDYLEGLELRAGDYINTAKGCFLELLLEPGDRIVRVSELSSFSVEGSDGIDLRYGRVRARVEKLAFGSSFRIIGRSASAGVRGTDFGYDLLVRSLEEGERIESRVYCFEGEIELLATARDPGKLGEVLDVKAGEMASIGRTKDGELEIITGELDREIEQFWTENDFVTSLTEEEIPDTGIDSKREIYRKASIVSGIGGLFLGSAAAVLAYSDLVPMDSGNREGLARGLAVSSGIFLGTSLFSFIASFQ